ncbi:hypothetical protein KIP88_03160 [Bradyrhizobium sp. SRL28]|uniref:hypothetical protein n=1 Tax=Bradyrhizobium sp. SRL28 TaxID=2836178 RepID=UPI001BDE3F57|nr:hypothetical protein [Bradyrhizobium sp. SRL28]MBT1509492.1 hypothetical protein [Bradyrhizobium sp. SRL28]
MTPIPGKPFMIVGAVALAGLVAGAVASSREPTPAPAASPGVVTRTAFDERFDVPDDFPLLRKTDRLMEPVVIPLKTELVMVQPEALIDVKKKTEPKKTEKPTMVATSEHNLCTRHNMHKVWVTSRRWRCRR